MEAKRKRRADALLLLSLSSSPPLQTPPPPPTPQKKKETLAELAEAWRKEQEEEAKLNPPEPRDDAAWQIFQEQIRQFVAEHQQKAEAFAQSQQFSTTWTPKLSSFFFPRS